MRIILFFCIERHETEHREEAAAIATDTTEKEENMTKTDGTGQKRGKNGKHEKSCRDASERERQIAAKWHKVIRGTQKTEKERRQLFARNNIPRFVNTRCMEKRRVVFVCIGTPKIVGDSLGPLVGDELRRRNVDAYVYGTRRRPITALNLHGYRKMLAAYHKRDLIIAIDATMGNLEDVGKLKISENGLRPAGAFRKNSGKLGDIGIMAIVGEREGDMLLQLKTADPAFVQKLADDVADLVTSANY